jgi:hypothetical protein
MVEALDISIEKPVHRVYYVDNQSLSEGDAYFD